ncbi:MAG: hypothetical protein EOO41_05005 [Methanobacteriota archaeon]|nr:MAG: hypothetical protein EOO41_05005 [Euryarchaeota archaeon]
MSGDSSDPPPAAAARAKVTRASSGDSEVSGHSQRSYSTLSSCAAHPIASIAFNEVSGTQLQATAMQFPRHGLLIPEGAAVMDAAGGRRVADGGGSSADRTAFHVPPANDVTEEARAPGAQVAAALGRQRHDSAHSDSDRSHVSTH